MIKNDIRDIERLIYQNPIINIKEFPPLDDVSLAIQDMESITFDYSHNNLAYAYIRMHNGTWFVDIYYYYTDLSNNEICMNHFIIAPGFQMNEEDESNFLYFVNCEWVLFNTRVCANYTDSISKIANDLNMKPYTNLGIALCHTYFASFKSGIREKLFKAGLEYVGMDIGLVDDWNIISSNIEEALNLPIKLLRKLNSNRSISEILADASGRRRASIVYEKYHSILNDIDNINEFQVHYLWECIQEDEKVDKKFIKQLADLESGWDSENSCYINGYEVYDELKEYRLLCDKVNYHKTVFSKYPSLMTEDIDRFYEAYTLLKSYVQNQRTFDKMMLKYSKKCKKYLYEDCDYEISIPRSAKDILDEAQQQHNCLHQCLREIILGEMIVVFMRKKSNRYKSLITIEIEKNYIKQARACCNSSPSAEQKLFIEKFAKAKGLIYM